MTPVRTRTKIPRSGKHLLLKELQTIPSVGPSIARDLIALGIRSIGDLESKDPETMYARHCAHMGTHVDRCVLYAFRCAVYYARTARPDPGLLLWWNWKDRRLTPRRTGKSRRRVG